MGKTSRRFIPTGTPGGFPGEPPRMPPPGSYGQGGRPTGSSPYKDDHRPPTNVNPGYPPNPGAGGGGFPNPGRAQMGQMPPYGGMGALPPFEGRVPPPMQSAYGSPQGFNLSQLEAPSNLPYGLVPPSSQPSNSIYPTLPPAAPYPSGPSVSMAMPSIPEGPGGYPSQPGTNPNYPNY